MKIHVYALPNGRAAITRLGVMPSWVKDLQPAGVSDIQWQLAWENRALAKTCFELTRPKDGQGRVINPDEHFDPANAAHIARGRALQMTEMDDMDLPASRARRDHWVIQGNRVVVSPVDLPPLP